MTNKYFYMSLNKNNSETCGRVLQFRKTWGWEERNNLEAEKGKQTNSNSKSQQQELTEKVPIYIAHSVPYF